MKRTILYAAALALCITALTACSRDETPQGTTASDATTEPATEVTGEVLGVPTHADYGGETFSILTAGNVAHRDFTFDEQSSLPLDSAQYRRRARVEEDYKVKIEQTRMQGYSSGAGPGFMEVSTAVNAGETKWDLALIAGYDVSVLAYNGLLYDLNSVPGIDLTKSWWDQKANEDLTISGRMFYTTGEISLSDNRSTNVMFFNKEMIQAYELDDPYELVRNNKWTFDKFAEMVKSVGEDLDQNGEYDQNDCFGLLSANDDKLAMLGAAREHIATIGADGNIVLTLYNERTVSIYDKYLALCGDYSHTFNWQFDYRTGKSGNVASNEERVAMMNTNRALFYPHMMFYIDYLRDIETNFGILPFPKFDESQAEYGHTVSAWHSEFLCVPRGVSDLSRTGIVLELLAYQGKKLLTPAYYEKTLVGQYTRDEESAEMLDIIFATRVFDVGIYYNLGGYKDKICSMLRLGDTLTNVYETNRSAAEQKLEGINELFRESTAD